MSKKHEELEKKIAAAKKERDDAPENLKKTIDNYDEQTSYGMRVATELFAGVLVGAVLGYFFDSIFKTLPIFLVIFVILGALGGFWNVYKLAFKNESDTNPPRN